MDPKEWGSGEGRREQQKLDVGKLLQFRILSLHPLKAGVTNCPYFRREEEDRRAYRFPERSAKEKKILFHRNIYSTLTLGNSVRGFLKSWEGKGV